MLKKSTAKKIKSLIYPLAFVLIIILSAVYKLVFKGNGDLSVRAFKSGKTAPLAAETVPADTSHETEERSEIPVTSETAAVTVQMISIYICGEVNRPGIYEAPKGTILNDIIEDAGGLTADASVSSINLVYQIPCNMSVYIPSRDETAAGFTGGDIIRQDGVYVWGNTQGASGGQQEGVSLMVNINTAAPEELKKLPGIGDVTAQAIVDYRRDNPFKTTDDIKNVTGIGDAKFNRIKDYICV